jgi:hypothetical protein
MAFTQADLDSAAKKRYTGLLGGYDHNANFDSWAIFDDGSNKEDPSGSFALMISCLVLSAVAGGLANIVAGWVAVGPAALAAFAGSLALAWLVVTVASRLARPYSARFASAARVLRSVRRDAGQLSGDERDQVAAQIDLLAERLCGVDGMMKTRVGCDMIDSAVIDAHALTVQIKADVARIRQSLALDEAARRFDTPEAQRWAARQTR